MGSSALDVFHAGEHLVAEVEALLDEGAAAAEWAERGRRSLLAVGWPGLLDHIGATPAEGRTAAGQAGLDELIGDFAKHTGRLGYYGRLCAGRSIARGGVVSLARRTGRRLKIPGRGWRVDHLEGMAGWSPRPKPRNGTASGRRIISRIESDTRTKNREAHEGFLWNGRISYKTAKVREPKTGVACMGTITRWIDDVKSEDHKQTAAHGLWVHYFDLLTGYALKKLRSGCIPRVVADEEDVAGRAFVRVWQGMESGRINPISRVDLIRFFLKAVKWEAENCRRHQPAGNPQREPVPTLDEEEAPGPSEEKLIIAKESYSHLLNLLNDETLRRIAVYKLIGHTNEEIKLKLGCSLASVERKLKHIRNKWADFAPERLAFPGPRGAATRDDSGGIVDTGDFEGISSIFNALLGRPSGIESIPTH